MKISWINSRIHMLLRLLKTKIMEYEVLVTGNIMIWQCVCVCVCLSIYDLSLRLMSKETQLSIIGRTLRGKKKPSKSVSRTLNSLPARHF